MASKAESTADVQRWWREQSAALWPAVLGSLSLRRSPCVRPNCAACRSGEQHPSYVLYCRIKGRRVAIYIPAELVPQIEHSLANGRALQALLYEAARRYANAVKHERVTGPTAAAIRRQLRRSGISEPERKLDRSCQHGVSSSMPN
jgi:hypothetical protein